MGAFSDLETEAFTLNGGANILYKSEPSMDEEHERWAANTFLPVANVLNVTVAPGTIIRGRHAIGTGRTGEEALRRMVDALKWVRQAA